MVKCKKHSQHSREGRAAARGARSGRRAKTPAWYAAAPATLLHHTSGTRLIPLDAQHVQSSAESCMRLAPNPALVAVNGLTSAKPQSINRSLRCEWSIMMLCGFTSRCMMPLEWQKSSACKARGNACTGRGVHLTARVEWQASGQPPRIARACSAAQPSCKDSQRSVASPILRDC